MFMYMCLIISTEQSHSFTCYILSPDEARWTTSWSKSCAKEETCLGFPTNRWTLRQVGIIFGIDVKNFWSSDVGWRDLRKLGARRLALVRRIRLVWRAHWSCTIRYVSSWLCISMRFWFRVQGHTDQMCAGEERPTCCSSVLVMIAWRLGFNRSKVNSTSWNIIKL